MVGQVYRRTEYTVIRKNSGQSIGRRKGKEDHRKFTRNN